MKSNRLHDGLYQHFKNSIFIFSAAEICQWNLDCSVLTVNANLMRWAQHYHHHHHHHHHGVTNTHFGHLFTCSGLTNPQVSSLVFIGSFNFHPRFLYWSPLVPSMVSLGSFNVLPRFLYWSPLVPSMVSPGSFSGLPWFLLPFSLVFYYPR